MAPHPKTLSSRSLSVDFLLQGQRSPRWVASSALNGEAFVVLDASLCLAKVSAHLYLLPYDHVGVIATQQYCVYGLLRYAWLPCWKVGRCCSGLPLFTYLYVYCYRCRCCDDSACQALPSDEASLFFLSAALSSSSLSTLISASSARAINMVYDLEAVLALVSLQQR